MHTERIHAVSERPVVLVIGGSSGIGLAAVRQLSEVERDLRVAVGGRIAER